MDNALKCAMITEIQAGTDPAVVASNVHRLLDGAVPLAELLKATAYIQSTLQRATADREARRPNYRQHVNG